MTYTDIIPEKFDKSQEVETHLNRHLVIARVETNFEKLPIWSPKPKRTTVFSPSKTIELEPEKLPDGNVVNRRIEIVPSAKYGYPTVQTQEYWYALQKLWYESQTRETGRIEFSRRQIIEDVLGKSNGHNPRKALELSIKQLATTHFEFDYLFYDKEKNETIKEVRGFNIIVDHRLTVKEAKNDIVHDKCSVTLHPLVVSNLRSGYFKPILLSVVLQLKSDIARLLYRKLDSQFSYYNKYEISTVRFFREQGLEGKEYYKPSVRKRLLEKGIQELINKPTSSGAVITQYEFAKTADNKDWKLLTYSNVKGKQKGDSVVEISSRAQFVTSETSEHVSQKGTKTAEQQVSPLPAQKVIPTDIESLLEYFDSTFHGGKRSSRSQSIIRKASSVVKEHGLPLGKYFVHYASGKCQETNYKPATFNGISKYLKEALEEHAREARINQRQKEELQKIHKENKQADHLKTYEKSYYEYGDSLIELYSYKYPQELIAFAKAESAQEQSLRAAIEEAPKSTCWAKKKQLEVFLKKEQKVIRFYEFFKEDTTLRIPDFWEWDREINPHSLSKPSSQKVSNHT